MKSIHGFIITLAVAASAITADAATITYINNAAGAAVAISVYGNNESTFAGLYSMSLTGAPTGYPTAFNAVCVDLQHGMNWGDSWDVNLIPIADSGLSGAGRIGYLYSTYAPTIVDNESAAGLQLAVWDILTDGGDGLDIGNFQASQLTAGILSASNNYIADSVGKTGDATWLMSTNETRQNLVGPGVAVPEPGSLALLGTVMLPLLGFCRRRK